MKKFNILVGAALFLLLSGCSDASADISDGNTTLFSVGKENVTKEDVYNYAKNSLAGDATMTLVRTEVLNTEVPLSAAMESKAKDTLVTTKENFGDDFSSMLKNNGYKNEEAYYEEVIVPKIQLQELTIKYLNEEGKLSEYQPLKLQMVVASSEDKANDALAAVKDGTSFKDAATSYGETAKSAGSEAIYSSASGLPSNVWLEILNVKEGAISDVIADTTNNLYYVVKVVKSNVEDFKEEAITALSTITTVSNTAFPFYLEKHDFQVWDIDTYNQIKTNNPTYLVQG